MMKNLSLLGVFCLALSLLGCSSSSSNDAAGQTNTNTLASGESADADGKAGNESSGDTAGDQNAEPGGLDSDGVDSGESDGDNTDGQNGSETDATGADTEGSDTADTEGTDTEGTGTEGTDTEPGTNTDGTGNDGAGSSTPAEDDGAAANQPDSESPDTPIGQMQKRIKTITSRTLIALNQSLSQGEMLTDRQQQCLGSFDPAFGEPLLAVNCETPLATGSVPILAGIASFNDTPVCRASIQNATSETDALDCEVNQAKMTVRTRWNLPDVGPGQPQRPQPDVGAEVSYNIEDNRLRVQNLDDRLSGVFDCGFDLSAGAEIRSGQSASCEDELLRVTQLIDSYLP